MFVWSKERPTLMRYLSLHRFRNQMMMAAIRIKVKWLSFGYALLEFMQLEFLV